MTPAAHTVATALGRLVSAVLYDATPEAQQAALRRFAIVNRMEGARLAVRGTALLVNDQPVEAPATADLVTQLGAHAVQLLDVYPAADAGEVMALARALAADADEAVPGAAFRVRFPPHNGRTIRVRVPEAPRGAVEEAARPLDPAVLIEDGGDAYLSFAAVKAPTASLPSLLDAMDAAPSLPALLHVLDALYAYGDGGLRNGRTGDLAAMLAGVLGRSAWETQDDRRRAIAGLLRRFRTAPMLTQLAGLIPRGGQQRQDAITVLANADTDGADAIIEVLVAATERAHRQAYVQALREVPVAAGSLAHMLGDNRWYVTRNAAYLIGELRLVDLDRALLEHRGHADERVRLAVLTALAKLGTPRAVGTLQAAIRDPAPAVRILAASAMASLAPERAVPIVRLALPRETDDDVRAALFGALAHGDTPEAVAMLAEAAAPGGRVFGRKPSKPRVAAVQALQRMTCPEAREALAMLTRDPDPDVRAAASAPPAPRRRTTSLTPLAVPAIGS